MIVPVPSSANVTFKNGDKEYGATTDVMGVYSISNLAPGNYTITNNGNSLNLLDFGCIRIFNPSFVGGVIKLYKALLNEKRNKDYPQFSDHYFTGEYPIKALDKLGNEKITQLSLLSNKSSS